MKPFYIYDATGRILRAGHCQDEDFRHQAGQGETVAEGIADFRTQYVDAGGQLRDLPAQPSQFHTLDWTTKTWLPDNERAWADVRARRNVRLAASDWTMLPDAPITDLKRQEWSTYRTALRDITLQPDPFNITWPRPPQ